MFALNNARKSNEAFLMKFIIILSCKSETLASLVWISKSSKNCTPRSQNNFQPSYFQTTIDVTVPFTALLSNVSLNILLLSKFNCWRFNIHTQQNYDQFIIQGILISVINLFHHHYYYAIIEKIIVCFLCCSLSVV